MTKDSPLYGELVHLLVGTAKAHHEATGGANPDWAIWYAERVAPEANRLLGVSRPVEDWADWLTGADERYQREEPDLSWPRSYAIWLLEEFAG